MCRLAVFALVVALAEITCEAAGSDNARIVMDASKDGDAWCFPQSKDSGFDVKKRHQG